MTLSRSKVSVLVYVIALLTIIAGILASVELRGATPMPMRQRPMRAAAGLSTVQRVHSARR